MKKIQSLMLKKQFFTFFLEKKPKHLDDIMKKILWKLIVKVIINKQDIWKIVNYFLSEKSVVKDKIEFSENEKFDLFYLHTAEVLINFTQLLLLS